MTAFVAGTRVFVRPEPGEPWAGFVGWLRGMSDYGDKFGPGATVGVLDPLISGLAVGDVRQVSWRRLSAPARSGR